MLTVEPAAGRVSAAPKSQERLAVLDGLRFVAALAVVLYHFTARHSSVWGHDPGTVFPRLHQLTAFGAFGVDLFFVISGFVILMTAWGRTLPKFVASRAGRLFPAYWTSVLLTGALLTVIWKEGSRRHLTDVMGNVSMTQAAFGIPHVDGVYWTLWAELRFYVLVAILIAVGITATRLVAFASLWPVVAGIAHQTGSDFVASLLIFDYAPLFAGGMMLYCVYRDPKNVVCWAVLIQNVTIAAVWSGGITAASIASNSVASPGPLDAAVVVVACFVAVGIAVLTRVRQITWRWLPGVGALTYPLYLVHEYWGWWFISIGHERLGVFATLAASTALVVIMAWLIHRFVEAPSGPTLRRAVLRSLEALNSDR